MVIVMMMMTMNMMMTTMTTTTMICLETPKTTRTACLAPPLHPPPRRVRRRIATDSLSTTPWPDSLETNLSLIPVGAVETMIIRAGATLSPRWTHCLTLVEVGGCQPAKHPWVDFSEVQMRTISSMTWKKLLNPWMCVKTTKRTRCPSAVGGLFQRQSLLKTAAVMLTAATTRVECKMLVPQIYSQVVNCSVAMMTVMMIYSAASLRSKLKQKLL